MIGLLQRVRHARVDVQDKTIAQVGRGLLVLVGIEKHDDETRAERLLEYQATDELENEADVWRDVLARDGDSAAAPVRPVEGGEQGGDLLTFDYALDEGESSALREQVCVSYHADWVEIVLAAVASVFAGMNMRRSSHVYVELPLQDKINFENLEFKRTVGPISSLFPFKLNLSYACDVHQTLCAVKEQFRAIPKNGIGYGLFCEKHDLSNSQACHSIGNDDVVVTFCGELRAFEPHAVVQSVSDIGLIEVEAIGGAGMQVRVTMLNGCLHFQ